jgi:3-hydroxybutyryl-CoA dehydrogenase
MVQGLEKSLNKQVEKGRLSEGDRDAALARVRGVSDLKELAECDIVIESVVEDLAIKKELFSELDKICPPHAILATNTSTLPVVEMAVSTERPGQVCGIHFFNPAPMMGLVEVIRAITTADETIETALAFASACGKSPVEVRDVAGFVVNALLFPYLNSAVRMLERGVASQDDIDAAMKAGANMPMGPFALIDLVGVDVTVAILDALNAENPDPYLQPAAHLRRMLAAGQLGRKSGRGFYDYTKR